jgi:hypothetical protein
MASFNNKKKKAEFDDDDDDEFSIKPQPLYIEEMKRLQNGTDNTDFDTDYPKILAENKHLQKIKVSVSQTQDICAQGGTINDAAVYGWIYNRWKHKKLCESLIDGGIEVAAKYLGKKIGLGRNKARHSIKKLAKMGYLSDKRCYKTPNIIKCEYHIKGKDKYNLYAPEVAEVIGITPALVLEGFFVGGATQYQGKNLRAHAQYITNRIGIHWKTFKRAIKKIIKNKVFLLNLINAKLYRWNQILEVDKLVHYNSDGGQERAYESGQDSAVYRTEECSMADKTVQEVIKSIKENKEISNKRSVDIISKITDVSLKINKDQSPSPIIKVKQGNAFYYDFGRGSFCAPDGGGKNSVALFIRAVKMKTLRFLDYADINNDKCRSIIAEMTKLFRISA